MLCRLLSFAVIIWCGSALAGVDPCDPDPCNPACPCSECDPGCPGADPPCCLWECGGNPCNFLCPNRLCLPECGGAPCHPGCPNSSCLFECDGGDPCNPGCPSCGACCLPGGVCAPAQDQFDCEINLGGSYQGDGSNCDWPGICDVAQDCCVEHGTPGCDDDDTPGVEDCVCSFDPSCCDTEWHFQCTQIAQDSCGLCCDDPCHPSCGGDPLCDPFCGGDPDCDPFCGGDPCQPQCASSGFICTGACCLSPPVPFSCVETTVATCNSMGGVYLGDNVPCEHVVREVNHNGPQDQWSHSISVTYNCPSAATSNGLRAMGGAGRSGPGPDCDPAPNCTAGPYEIDAWSTFPAAGANCEDFGHPDACPIPAGFFNPGSDPFLGEVCFQGGPLGSVTPPGFGGPLDFGGADTLVRRDSDPFSVCDLPGATQVVVPIELVALNLVSSQPITVTETGGPTFWDVRVELDPVTPQPGGTLTATKTHCNGGTFSSSLAACPRFVFTEVGNPTNVRTLDYCVGCDSGGILMTSTDAPWVHDVAGNMCMTNPVCSSFVPGLDESEKDFNCDCNSNDIHDRCDAANGDVTGDGLSNLDDWEIISTCLEDGLCHDGVCAPPKFSNLCCHLVDFDGDGDIDLEDFAGFQRHLTP